MKRITCLILTILIFLPSFAFAKNGDVVGHIYSTDIVAKIGENEVPSYNIGGRTAVICEDIEAGEYGFPFFVSSYNDEKRLLTVIGHEPYKTDYKANRGKVGKVLGDIYETDIKVIFNDNYIDGYNIGGKTAILLEDLGDLTDSPNEKYGYSKYCAKTVWDEENKIITVNFASKYTNFSFSMDTHHFQYNFKDGVLSADYDSLNPFYSEMFIDDNNKNEINIIKPLYLELDGEKEEIGTYFYNSQGFDEFIINDIEYLKTRLKNYIASKKVATTYDETLSFFDDKVNYETFKSMKTEDYTLLLARDLKTDEERNVMYIAVDNKSGDYVAIFDRVTDYTVTELEKIEKNTVNVIVWPFAGPHGATTSYTEYNLEWYFE